MSRNKTTRQVQADEGLPEETNAKSEAQGQFQKFGEIFLKWMIQQDEAQQRREEARQQREAREQREREERLERERREV